MNRHCIVFSFILLSLFASGQNGDMEFRISKTEVSIKVESFETSYQSMPCSWKIGSERKDF